jgi:threonine synthase
MLHERLNNDPELAEQIRNFWAGDPLPIARVRQGLRQIGESAAFSLKAVKIKDLTEQRFAFVARLIQGAGYRGWVLLIDEVELVGRYSLVQRGRSYAELARWLGRIEGLQTPGITTVAAVNVHAVAVDGTFDDCQAIVKGMFNHHAFRERVALSGVNSINWARIVAQAVYYFTAAVSLGAPQRKIAFTVPTGNFGDVYAGYVASRMGLPVDRLVIATNVNDILARTLATGTYEPRDVVPTTSPSMDIQVSSNFERLLFDAYRRDGGAIRTLMAQLAQSGRFTLSASALSDIRALFAAGRANEEEVAATIRTVLRETGRFVDPHTAVGIAVAEKEPRDPAVPMVVLSTAHPAKFPDAVEAACGQRPSLPEWLSDLDRRPERVTFLPADQEAVERFVLATSRAAQEGAAA